MNSGSINEQQQQPFLRPFVRDYPGEPVPEERLIHPPSWSSSNLYQLLPSTTIHSILPVQITCVVIFLHNLFPCPPWSTFGLEPSTSYSIHFFSQSVSFFCITCPYHHNMFCCTRESKKGCHPNHGYNFVNSWSICKILSLLQRAVNFQQHQYLVTHHTLSMLLHYLGKRTNQKFAILMHVKKQMWLFIICPTDKRNAKCH